MKRRAVRVVIAACAVLGMMTIPAPAYADPCDVDIKHVHIDLIDCG